MGRCIMGLGAQQKAGFCVWYAGQMADCQYFGDLGDAEHYRAYHAAVDDALKSWGVDALAVDMHPDYAATQLGLALSAREHLPLLSVQHHHAHIASVLADMGADAGHEPVLGVALDGLGFGDDGTLWGAEFLRVQGVDSLRLGRFAPVCLPGGGAASQQPWRNLLAHLFDSDWSAMSHSYADVPAIQYLQCKPLDVLIPAMQQGIHSPRASSAGRLFDAMAAALNAQRETMTHEAQAAMALEALASTVFSADIVPYGFDICENQGMKHIVWAAMWQDVFKDLQHGGNMAMIAARFHQTIIAAVSKLACLLCREHALTTVVLSGGVFQNRLLREGLERQLLLLGFDVLLPKRTPLHDGGIALGQAWIARARLKE